MFVLFFSLSSLGELRVENNETRPDWFIQKWTQRDQHVDEAVPSKNNFSMKLPQ